MAPSPWQRDEGAVILARTSRPAAAPTDFTAPLKLRGSRYITNVAHHRSGDSFFLCYPDLTVSGGARHE